RASVPWPASTSRRSGSREPRRPGTSGWSRSPARTPSTTTALSASAPTRRNRAPTRARAQHSGAPRRSRERRRAAPPVRGQRGSRLTMGPPQALALRAPPKGRRGSLGRAALVPRSDLLLDRRAPEEVFVGLGVEL